MQVLIFYIFIVRMILEFCNRWTDSLVQICCHIELRPFYGLCQYIKLNTIQATKPTVEMWIILPGKVFVVLFNHPNDSHNIVTLHSQADTTSFSLLYHLTMHWNINQHKSTADSQSIEQTRKMESCLLLAAQHTSCNEMK